MSTETEVKKMLDGIEQKMKDGLDALQKKYDDAIAAEQKGEQVRTELKGQIENLKGELERTASSLRDLEEKGALPKGQQRKGVLQLIQGSTEFKSFDPTTQQNVALEIKGDDYRNISKKALVMAGTSNLLIPSYDPTIHEQPRSELFLADLLPSIPVTNTEFTYFQQKPRTNSAGMVAEGGAKPEGAVEFEQITDRVKKMAEWIPITEEAASDIPQLVGYIENLLAYDLAYRKEQQILKGDGTGENLNGLMTQATPYDATRMRGKSTDQVLDIIRRMLSQVRIDSKRPADFITMSEIDWTDTQLLKDDSGKYMFASIQGMTTDLLWGRPVIVGDAMDDTTGELLVGHSRAAMIYNRELLRIVLGRINDDLIKNRFVILAESRLGLAVRMKQAFVKHQLTPAGGGSGG